MMPDRAASMEKLVEKVSKTHRYDMKKMGEKVGEILSQKV